jgi:hypothetical protein
VIGYAFIARRFDPILQDYLEGDFGLEMLIGRIAAADAAGE